MIKSALEYLKKEFLAASELVEAHGCMYSPVGLNVIRAPEAAPLTIHTLQGLVDYIGGQALEVRGCFIHVLSPDMVRLTSSLTEGTRQRETLAEVSLLQSAFRFGQYIPQEEFIVGVQSQFVETETRAALLKIAGSITAEAIQISEDDGVTQRATAKVGIARQAVVDLPNPVSLRPYRTFTEVDQPESLFVFRMRGGNIPSLALFEADGGAWRNQAIKDIAYWLTGALQGKGMAIIS
jgi:hypothetical protein